MHHIQDKDLDQLFKDRFEYAEMTPPAGLWDKIGRELAPAKKRRFPVYRVAAAVALVAVGAGLLWSRQEKIQLQGPVVIVRVQKPALRIEKPAAADKRIVAEVVKPAKASVTVASRSNDQPASGKEISNILKANVVIAMDKKTGIVMQPKGTDDHLKVISPVLKPDDGTQVAKQGEEATVIASVETPVIVPEVINETIMSMPLTNRNEYAHDSFITMKKQLYTDENETERKGIRNVGDLVNFVVNKVDKREQKLLEFNTDDDDNSSLVAINIGFIKFNSRRHK